MNEHNADVEYYTDEYCNIMEGYGCKVNRIEEGDEITLTIDKKG